MRSSTSRRNQRGFTLVEMLIVIGIIVFLIALLLPAARRSIEAGRQVTCLNHLRQIAAATIMYCQENDGTFPGVTGVEPLWTSGPAPLPWEWIYWESIYSAPFNDVTRSPIMRYLPKGETRVLRCPSDDIASHTRIAHPAFGTYQYSYVMNGWTATWPQDWDTTSYRQKYGIWPASHLHDVKDPSQKIFFLEEDPRFLDDGSYFIKIFLNPSEGPWAEPPSFVHDVYRDLADPTQMSNGWQSRTNVVFCDGHGEFVTGLFIAPGIAHPGANDPQDRVHFDPHL